MNHTTATVSPQDQRQPASFPRRVLLAVSGLSPQIVTETLYALALQIGQPFIPTEIHLITTGEGAQRAQLALLSTGLGWFHKLCSDYRLPNIQFDRSHIHTMRDAHGNRMDDIRSVADNQAAADFITARVREFSADPQCALHVSIAGGRKTMGFYLGYALSLYGRPQDRLSHVLVSAPFENSFDFFYPTPYSRILETHDKNLADTAQAQVTLAEIPFVSLRHGLPEALLAGQGSFSDAVAAVQTSLAAPLLRIDLKQRCIEASGKQVKLPPAELALLAVFARRVLQGAGPLPAPHKDVPDQEWALRYLREYRAITGTMADIDSTEKALKKGMNGDFFSPLKSKLERRLRSALGQAATHYRINDGDKRPRRYGLTLGSNAISFVQNTTQEEEK